MSACQHITLELLPSRKPRLRCRRCHLTLEAQDLGDGPCPECLESAGTRNYDFEEVRSADHGMATYRCEQCGVLVNC